MPPIMSNSVTPLVQSLRQVVADYYALIGQTHICHWNVRGESFFALHVAFEEQYTELFTAVDEIAERVRALGSLAPGGLSNLAKASQITEINEDASANAMVAHLLKAHEITVASLQAVKEAASEQDDNETEDLAIARTQIHEKTMWMLRSFLA